MRISREQLLEAFTVDIRKRKTGFLAFIPFVFLFIWVLLLFLSPLTQPPGTIYLGNSGKVSVTDNTPYINTHVHNILARYVYLSGDVMCHQHADRSFFVGGNQMPYCSRCTGIFLGLAFGAFIGALFRVRIGLGFYLLVIIPLALDGGVQLLTSYESTNFTRIVTGTLVGTFTSIVMWYVYQDVHEFSRK